MTLLAEDDESYDDAILEAWADIKVQKPWLTDDEALRMAIAMFKQKPN